MSLPSIAAFVLIVISILILVYFTRHNGPRPNVSLRDIKAYESLQKQVAKSVESGRDIHFSVGRGSLEKVTNPASLASLSVLESLSKEASANNQPPAITSGDGTLFVASQDMLRGAYEESGRLADYPSQASQFIAPDSSPLTYGAGISDIINQGEYGSNLILGHVGSKLALITEAAERENMTQIIGSDDLIAQAVALTVTDDVLLGEELYAAAAYLQKEPSHIASLQLQDILRIFAALSILVAAIIALIFK